ncbi:adenylate cyclase [Shewanella hanedai]|uniref:CYTH domain-containing protein n=1 Tax=Shewanella hanedai TaxID=25 RepID=A0A553JUW0_SHEHA|nr:CYTH domain-containing protein [Shewanella hanedai]TRY16247.1 CYTH domain-containing protein [Shewanella hanedai]GGI67430.1 adenylate cyclase [Shewanella hanedai]
MNTEIELKLFFQLEQQETLINLLDNLPLSEQQWCRNLSNAYFDTADLQLRRWDMGLRVRGCDGALEQTIKTAGSVVGGIHSRPEFNVDIDKTFPILSLFPEKIWPEQAIISSVQSELTCLFNTDFSRRTWHIYVDKSLIEVALDIGKIEVEIAGERRVEPICELEFELMAGEASSLIKLGLQVAESLPVRLGKASKAQRGYRLASQASPLSLEVLEFISLRPEQDLKQAFITLLATGLERWQLLEAMILESDSTMNIQAPYLCYRLRACIRLLRFTLAQFDLLNGPLTAKFDCIEGHLDFIETSLSCVEILQENSMLIAKLPQHKQLSDLVTVQLQQLSIPQRISMMLQEVSYGSLQLSLVELLFDVKSGQTAIDKTLSLQNFADKVQDRSWLRIVDLMPLNIDLSSADYQTFARALDESVFVGVAYGELYSAKSRDLFRLPWQDLTLGIRTLAAYRQLGELSQQNAIDISQWLTNKEESLLFAMEHSRRIALKNEPYWR